MGTKSLLVLMAGVAALILGAIQWNGGHAEVELSHTTESAGRGRLDEPETDDVAVDEVTASSSEVPDVPREAILSSVALDRLRRVRVVRDEDGVALPGAEVRFVTDASHDEWFKEEARRDCGIPCIQALSEPYIADQTGEVLLPIENEGAWLSGALGHYFRLSYLRPGDKSEELRLLRDPPLKVLVVDPAGKPTQGVPVGLFEYGPDHPSGTCVGLACTDQSGVATIHHHGNRVGKRSQYRVALNFPLASPVEEEVDWSKPPAEPIRLVMPSTGSVRVVLAGDDQEPWPLCSDMALYAMVPSTTDPGQTVRSDRRDYRRATWQEEAVFEHVEVGIDVHLFVSATGTIKEVALTHWGPAIAGEQVVIRVRFTERHAWVEGRFALGDGGDVPMGLSAWAQDLDDGTSAVPCSMVVGSDGSFKIALREEVLAGGRCRLTIQPNIWGGAVLSAAFEIVVPAPGTGVAVGLVVLNEAPLIVGGRVIDQDGEPVKYVAVKLGEQLARANGTYIWNPVASKGVRIDREGRFEIRGEMFTGTYGIRAVGLESESAWIPFEIRRADLVVVLADRSGWFGQLILPPEFPVERLSVVATLKSGAAPDWSLRRNPRVGVQENGSFKLPGLAPGTYVVGLLTGKYSDLIAELGTIVVSSNEVAPIGDWVVLNSLKVIDIEVVAPDAGAVQGFVTVGDSIRRFLIQDGLVSLVTPLPGIDVTVFANGYRSVHLANVRSSTRVDLEPGIPVVVSLPGAFTLPEFPLCLEVALIPQEGGSVRDVTWVYTRDSAERLVIQSHDQYPSRRFGTTKEVVLGAPAPGGYELHWWVIRSDEGGLTGSRTNPLRWETGHETVRVEEAGLILQTQPVREEYARVLQEAELEGN